MSPANYSSLSLSRNEKSHYFHKIGFFICVPKLYTLSPQNYLHWNVIVKASILIPNMPFIDKNEFLSFYTLSDIEQEKGGFPPELNFNILIHDIRHLKI